MKQSNDKASPMNSQRFPPMGSQENYVQNLAAPIGREIMRRRKVIGREAREGANQMRVLLNA